MHENKSITRVDVAKAAGVSTYTVSQSLAGRAGPSEETRKRVLAVAEAMGYRPNVVASLMSRQKVAAGAAKRVKHRLSVVYLSTDPMPQTLFLQTCAALGVDGQVENPAVLGTPEEASRVLWNRGVDGLVVSAHHFPWDAEQRARFAWHKFSVVKLGRAWPDVRCHLVRHSAFDYMALTLDEVLKRGYRRIAVVMAPSDAPVDDNARFGAILNLQHRIRPAGVSLEWRELPRRRGWVPGEAEQAWLEAYGPDAVVFYVQRMADVFFDNLPPNLAGVGVAAVLVSTVDWANVHGVSGCSQQLVQQWQRALKLLTDLMGRGERGFASQPMEDVIEPEWVEGRTLPWRS